MPVGRDAELAAIRSFVDGAAEVSAALVLEGEPGIGKSVLWRAAVDHARSNGLTVVSCSPAEADRALGYVGLGDLLEPVIHELLAGLLAPRRHSLEVALLRKEPSGEAVDRRSLSVGVRDALQLLCEQGPVLLAIDDVQWLDPSSSGALAFALRRLDESRFGVVLTRRLDEDAPRSELEQALPSEQVRRLRVGPITPGALHRLLHERLGRAFARQTLLRIHERSGGNPFFALELARVMAEDVGPLEPLSIPETLEGLLRERITSLPASTREALTVVAAAGSLSESLLRRAGAAAAALESAFAAQVIERELGVIRFTHPLLASVAYGEMVEERRHVHKRLAEVVDDPVIRARHLALSTAEADASVADSLDAAAEVASDRGAAALAAELAEQALRLTPPCVDEHGRRALAAARAHLNAGEWTRARSLATELLAATPEGPPRADALLLLSEFERDDLAVPVLEEAAREAASQPSLEARIRLRLAVAERFRKGWTGALDGVRAALELVERVDDDILRFEAFAHLSWLAARVGDLSTHAYRGRAIEVARRIGDQRLLGKAATLEAEMLAESGSIDSARALLEREYRDWQERDELFAAELRYELAWIELWAGQWELAAAHAAGAREVALQYGDEENQLYIPSAWIALHRGQFDVAQADAARGLELCEKQIGFHPPLLKAVPGLIALWSGEAASAAVTLGEADWQASSLGWGSPHARPWTADYAEALLALGRIDEAVRVVDRWEADARRYGGGCVLAQVTRCRGLIAAAGAALDEASTRLEEAVAQHDELGDTFGRARAELALGVVRRRARQKRAARDAIAAAVSDFEELGATSWLERARHELGAIGGRTRQEGLTPGEQRVAALVVEGRTNREVAAALFLAERTVASRLTSIYAKLGVRSRTELARKMQTF